MNRAGVHYNRNGWLRPAVERRSCLAHPIKGTIVEEPLKHLMQELGNAINDSLSESDRIAEAIGEIKRAGYDVFLVLEATIGFNKREEGDEEADSAVEMDPPAKRKFDSAAKVKWTSQDHKFLRALKISTEGEE